MQPRETKVGRWVLSELKEREKKRKRSATFSGYSCTSDSVKIRWIEAKLNGKWRERERERETLNGEYKGLIQKSAI